MAKRFGAGQCIHCQTYVDQLTSDHIFPESWYPDTTPLGLEKWQAPSCKSCNSEHGKIERRLLQQLGLGTDPWVSGAAGIGEKALRSFDPRVAKNDKDRKARENARDKVARELQQMSQFPAGDVLPNIGTIQAGGGEGYAVTEVSAADIGRVVKKIVLGITYLRTGQILPRKYRVAVLSPSENAKLPESWLHTSRDVFVRPPGFLVHRHYVDDDEFAAFFSIFIWERYEFCAAIVNTELETRVAAG